MQLFYVDESGTTATPRVNHSKHAALFTLAAVGIADTARASLASDLRSLREEAFGSAVGAADAWRETEIKARYLWQVHETICGRPHPTLPDAYRPLATKASFNRLLHSIERIYAKFRPTVFAVTVDKGAPAAPVQRQETIGMAYAALYQSVALTMENVHGGTTAAFIADQQEEHQAFFRSGEMGRMRDERASKGKYRPDFNLLIDTPVWIDSTLSVWDREIIQLADLAAFAVRAWAAEGAPPQGRHFLWSAIRPCLAADWRKGTGVRGAGLTVIPDLPGAFGDL